MDKLYPILTQMKTSLDELETIMIEERSISSAAYK